MPDAGARKSRASSLAPPIARVKRIGLVANFELQEALRSRKASVLLALYVLGSLGGSAVFIQVLGAIRGRLEVDLGQVVDMKQLMASPGMARVAGALIGDPDVAGAVLGIPAMALFFGWMAMNFFPLLVLFTSAGAISGDVASGAARFSLFRVDRLSWAIGKLVGQTCLMAVGVLAGAVACFAMGALWLDDMPHGATAFWLLRISGRTIVYCFAYLGMVMCASQLARTATRAAGLALLLVFGCAMLGKVLDAEPVATRAPQLFGALAKLFPNGHYLSLWHPGLVESVTAMVGLSVIGLGFFALGFWRFNGRDA